MTGMNEQIRLHYETTISLRLSQVALSSPSFIWYTPGTPKRTTPFPEASSATAIASEDKEA